MVNTMQITKKLDSSLITIALTSSASFPDASAASLQGDSNNIEILCSSSFSDTEIEHVLAELTTSDHFPLALRFHTSLPAEDQSDAHLLAEGFALLARNFADKSLILVHSNDAFAASNTIRAEALKAFTAIIPIEELFPNHAWETFQAESLAACYHVLAAYFIKLGDLESAEDCLQQSEPLEASPRTLALRALISQRHGETLGAVANMVSSLQQYEQRKNPTTAHYVSFQPKDIEVVNVNLKDGLEALNRKDNAEAFNKFSEAVFNFDGFFETLELV